MRLHRLPGYTGQLLVNDDGTPTTVPDAFPNGSRVVKVAEEPGDGTPIGTEGTVLSALDGRGIVPPEFDAVDFFYFVEWDDRPKTCVGVMDRKIELQSAWDGQQRPLIRSKKEAADARG